MNKDQNNPQELKDHINNLMKNQNYQEALECINECPDTDQNKIYKAYCMRKIGKIEEAFELANSILWSPDKHSDKLSMVFIRICLDAGKYQEALQILQKYSYDQIIYSDTYAHVHFGLGDISKGHQMLGDISQHFNPFRQGILANLLAIYCDPNLKEVLTKDDFTYYCDNFIMKDFQLCHKYSTQFFSKDKKDHANNILIRDTSFYQYQSLNLNTLSNIQNSCVYFGEYSNFNDPADPPIKLDKYFNPLHEITKNIRISCFTTKNNNLLMWSHYADKHQGICIEYNIEVFLNRRECDTILFQKVRYKENLNFRTEGLFQVTDHTDTQTPWDVNILGLFTVKHIDWKYEDEYRLIRYFNNDTNYTSSIPIKSIYMGKDVSLTHQHIIEQTIKDTEIQLFIMKPNRTNMYQLIPEKIIN